MLTQKTIDKLESKGLVLFGKKRDLIMVCKPLTTQGNCIKGRISTPICEFEEVNGKFVLKEDQFETDAPVLGIFIEKNGYRVQVWQWVPGPGPGDFQLIVSSEEEAFEATINYFFEQNEHFQAYRKYHLENPYH